MDFSSISDNEIAQVHRYLDPGAVWDICAAPGFFGKPGCHFIA